MTYFLELLTKEETLFRDILGSVFDQFCDDAQYISNTFDFCELFIDYLKDITRSTETYDETIYSRLVAMKRLNNTLPLVYFGDCIELLKQLPSNTIDLVVTSPPYYNARDYSQYDTLKHYLNTMESILIEIYRTLSNHRYVIWNVSDIVGNDRLTTNSTWGSRKIPLAAYFISIFERIGFTYIDDIIWDKGEVQTSRHKNKPYPMFQYPINCYEHILIFQKNKLDERRIPCSSCCSLQVSSNSQQTIGIQSFECKNPICPDKSKGNRGKRFSQKTILTQHPKRQQHNEIDKDFIKKFRRDIVPIHPVVKVNSKGENTLKHTAPFPFDIPEYAIKCFSYKNDIVFDPFGGSMTTSIVANQLERRSISCELRKDLFEKCICENFNKHGIEWDVLHSIL